MKSKAYLISPSSHFLKSLANFLRSEINLRHPEATKHWVIFSTKRAALFFKYYLLQKEKGHSFFLPKILSWEEFLKELYLQITPAPRLFLPEGGKILIFLQTLPSIGIHWEEPEKLLFWGARFLEVFEEFEKEGKIPQDLLYPPETLPEQAKYLFERLSKSYKAYKEHLKRLGISFPSEILSNLRENLSPERIPLNLIKGLYFAGFVALREGERAFLREIMKYFEEKDLPLLFFFEDNPNSPHPLIKKTLNDLALTYAGLPRSYLEQEEREPKVFLFSFPEQESEMQKLREHFEGYQITSPDEVAIVLPNSLSLLPLLHQMAHLPLMTNITLPFPAKLLPLNRLLLLLLRLQRERNGNLYPTNLVWKILNFPLIKALYREDKLFENLLMQVKTFLRETKALEISLPDLANKLESPYKKLFEELNQRLFASWENLHSPSQALSALRDFLEFIKPLTQGEDLNTLLTKHFLFSLEEELLPLLEISTLWENLPPLDRTFMYRFLENLLLSLDLALYGDPLSGLQIIGFLESRLLSFKRLFLLDTNEGALPPTTPLNPLLTEEIKTYLGLPIYRNELWDYYFERLISSSEEIFIFYLKTEKGKDDLLGEPSRYIQKLKWKREKEGRNLREEPFKLLISTPGEIEALPKGEKEQALIQRMIKYSGLSRYALETYLTCPVKFYFHYLLSLKEQESLSLEEKEVGLFLHTFFEEFFKNYLNRSLSFGEIVKEKDWTNLFNQLWQAYNFDQKLDPLSAFLSYKIAYASIERYFHYLCRLEEDSIEKTIVLGVEENLQRRVVLHFSPHGVSEVVYWGRVDFIIKRVLRNGSSLYLILDFKSNPSTKPTPRNLNKLIDFTPPSDYKKESLFAVKKLFGSNLTNFQLLFYLYLYLDNLEKLEKEEPFFNFNAGYITPTDFKEPESYLFKSSSKKKNTKREKAASREEFLNLLKESFEPLLFWLTQHLVETQEFYFTEKDDDCKYCPYKVPCKILRIEERPHGKPY